MGKLLKVAIGAIWTFGFVVCSPLNASLPGHSTVLSNSLEQAVLKDNLPLSTSSVEPLDFSNPSVSSTRVAATDKEIGSKRQQEAPILWSQVEEIQFAQGLETPTVLEKDRFRGMMQNAIVHSLHGRSMGNIVQAIAQQLLGSPYQPNLLDQSGQETLVVSLSQFDCVLFVETVLALARGIAVQDYSYKSFTDHLQEQRYRNGKLNGYCSRLHYFSEWITDNQERGQILNLTPELGGVSLQKSLNFMSQHRSSYPRLVNDESTYQCVRQVEANFHSLPLTYIPTNRIYQIYSRLQPGDIVAIATNIAGLDVTHTGLVYRNGNGGVGLIHAAPNSGVKISPDLKTYVSQVDDAIGILVARTTDPRSRKSGQPVQRKYLSSQSRRF